MSSSSRVMSSEYMRWAKTHFHARYNLANSGITNYPLSKLPVKIEDLELTGNSYYGYEPLHVEIAKRYDVTTDKIFFTLGTSFANFMVMTILFETGNEILIEHPTYELLISTAHHVGYNVKRFPRRFDNGFGIDIKEIKKSITPRTKLIVLTNLHNPSSVLIDKSTLCEIGAIASKFGSYVMVDEVYLDALFEQTIDSSVHLGNNFIVTNSLTKIYGLSGLRCGWVLAEPELIKRMWHLNDLFYVNHVHPGEQLSVIAFKQLDRIKKWARRILEINHQVVNRFTKERNDLEVIQPGYGTVVFPRLKKGNVDELFNILSNKYDTAITPGRFFEMPQHFRIGLGCEPEIFMIGLNNLGKALDELSGKK